MKIRIKRCRVHMTGGRPWISFEVLPADFDDAMPLNNMDVEGCTVEVLKPKRTLRANSYLWSLCAMIADKAFMTKQDVYRRAVREAGLFDDLYMRQEAFEKFRSGWSRKGIAWMVEADPPKNGWMNVRVYYGSSEYNSAEFSRLLDYVIDDAKFYGIDPLPKEEIDRMIDAWRKENG